MNIKQITLVQLQKTPIWIFETQENGDILIKATDKTKIDEDSENPPESYIVHSQFVAANGKMFQGFCSPEDPSGLDYVQPVIIYEGAYLELYPNRSLTEAEQKSFLDALGLTFDELFPLRCIPEAKVHKIDVQITILDFEHMKTNY